MKYIKILLLFPLVLFFFHCGGGKNEAIQTFGNLTIEHTKSFVCSKDQPLKITVRLADASKLYSVKLYYKTGGDSSFAELLMTSSDSEYTKYIPAAALNDSCVFYYIESQDYNFIRAYFGANGMAASPPLQNPVCIFVDQSSKIAASYYFSLALKADGSVCSWGYNNYGQLGNSTTSNSSLPVNISNLSDIVEISAGYYQSAAVKKNGTILTWGRNNYGQLGAGNNYDTHTPVTVKNIDNIKSVSQGIYHTVILKNDGTVWSCGYNNKGAIGNSISINAISNSFIQIPQFNDIIAVEASEENTIGLKSDGTVWICGGNNYGQLGNGETNVTISSLPIQVSGLTDVISISSKSRHIMALKRDGTVWTWGYNSNYQLGDLTNTTKYYPEQVTGLSDITSISTGRHCSWALKNDGTVFVAGYFSNYNLYNYQTENYDQKRFSKLSGISNIVGISAGYYHFHLLENDGSVMSIGDNREGALGVGFTGSSSNYYFTSPLQLTFLKNIKCISANYYHTLALQNDGVVSGWGDNSYNQIGTHISHVYSSEPVFFNARAISTGAIHSVFLKNDGTVWCVGDNRYGQLGNGTSNSSVTPVNALNLSNIIDITSSEYFTAALKYDGTVYVWGYNRDILDTTAYYLIMPERIPNLYGVKSIKAGSRHLIALKYDGTVWTWGYNNYGQLGNGSIDNCSVPARIESLNSITEIAAAYYDNIALQQDGSVWSWGYNVNGEAGIDSSTDYITVPLKLNSIGNIIAISSCYRNSLALAADGSVWSWGYNSYGQIGDGTTTYKKYPVKISGFSGISSVFCGTEKNFAIAQNGNIFGWGSNNYSCLGIQQDYQYPCLFNFNQ